MNPMALLQMKNRLDLFQQEHPKVFPFFNAVNSEAMRVGTIMELKVTTPEGKELAANIKLTENDLETLGMLFSNMGE